MPKIVNHEEYREELLTRSFELFARKGYDSVTMREIAKELNISTGTLYHYFADKSEIFRQMLEYLSRNRVLQIMGGLDRVDQSKDKLLALIQNVLSAEKFFQDLLFLLFDYLRKNNSTDPENFIQPIIAYFNKSIQKSLGIDNEEQSGLLLNFLIGLIIQKMMNPITDTKSLTTSFISLYESKYLKKNPTTKRQKNNNTLRV